MVRIARPLVIAAVVASTLISARPAAAVDVTCTGVPDPATSITCQSWTVTPQSDGSTIATITVTTPAILHAAGSGTPSLSQLAVPIGVNVYLPAGYDATRAAGYPALYLLHGGGGTYSDWADTGGGDIVSTVRGSAYTGIVVMPEGGRAGWYRDWAGNTDGYFAPAWETFHIDQLIPWIDAHFNTVDDRAGRAIAGLSMGGAGALVYSAAHPDLFSAVGSFSGGTDVRDSGAQQIISDSMWQAGAAIGTTGLFDGKFRVNKYNGVILEADQAKQAAYRMATIFGPPAGWSAINPVEVASAGGYQAYSTKLGLYVGGCGTMSTGGTVDTGTGRTNSASCAYSDPNATDGEPALALMNRDFHSALAAAGVNHRYCTGTGNHSWSYWRSDLTDFLAYAYGPGPDTRTCNNA